MRWIPFLLVFLLVYVEISVFIAVADVLGVLLTLVLVFLTSCIGFSLVRRQGTVALIQIQQKLSQGENPATEVVKSVSLLLAGALLMIPGFFTDFLGLLLLLPPVQRRITLKLMPYIRIQRNSSWFKSTTARTIEGEYQRKDDDK